MNLDFNELPLELYSEIFGWLKPYALSNVSLTSKHYRQQALIESLWKKHLDSEFPYCLEKGTSFERYSLCKRRFLKHHPLKEYRKLVLLIEANQFEEIRTHLKSIPITPSFHLSLYVTKKDFLERSLSALVNEQKDQRIRDLFFELVKEEYTLSDPMQVQWAMIFGQLNLLSKHTPARYDIERATLDGALTTLDCLVKKGADFDPEKILLRAVELGRIDMLEWALDHMTPDNKSVLIEEGFTGKPLSIAASCGYKDILLYLIKHFHHNQEQITSALKSATAWGRPSTLEVLLNLLPQTELSINDLLNKLNFVNQPNETAACLKLLLDNGANIEHKIFGKFKTSRYLSNTPLYIACSFPGNEIAIELLLSRKANPNVENGASKRTPLMQAVQNYDSTIVKMLIDYGAK